MKKLLLINLLLFISLYTYSQEFKMKLWLEDSAGNKDSVEIGYDNVATDGIDLSFGEENIFSSPWGNEFEARAGDATITLNGQYNTSPTTIHTKKQIIGKTCNFFHMMKIAINCKNFPLIIKWDTSVFSSNSCGYSSFITSGTIWGGDWFDGVMAFMNPLHDWYDKDSLIITEIGDLSSPVHYSQNGQDIIQLNVSFGDTMPTTSMGDFIIEKSFDVFPNPSNGSFYIKSKINMIGLSDIKIYNILGELLYHKIKDNNAAEIIEINNINFENGIYQIVLSYNKSLITTKLIISK